MFGAVFLLLSSRLILRPVVHYIIGNRAVIGDQIMFVLYIVLYIVYDIVVSLSCVAYSFSCYIFHPIFIQKNK